MKASLIKGEKMEALNGVQSSLPTEVTIAVHQQLQFFLLKAPLKTGFVTFYHTTTIFWEGRRDLPHPTIKPAVVVGLGSHHSGHK